MIEIKNTNQSEFSNALWIWCELLSVNMCIIFDTDVLINNTKYFIHIWMTSKKISLRERRHTHTHTHTHTCTYIYIYICLWLIRIVVGQKPKPIQHCKAIIFQLKMKKQQRKTTSTHFLIFTLHIEIEALCFTKWTDFCREDSIPVVPGHCGCSINVRAMNEWMNE